MAMQFTQNLTMHLNGGSKFSELRYRIAADGQETPIIRGKRTDGRPKYRITDDLFRCTRCDAAFDNAAARGEGLMAWLEAHAHPATAEAETAEIKAD